MEKTKLGVSTGLMGAAAYVLGGYSGLWVVLLLMFYVLMYETDRNLRMNVVQATVLCMVFSMLSFFLGGINGVLNFSILGRLNIYSGLYNLLSLIEVVVFFLAILKAFNGEVLTLPIITDMTKKHFTEGAEA